MRKGFSPTATAALARTIHLSKVARISRRGLRYDVTDLAPIAEKLAKVVRMFGSDNPNLRAEAWKALVRTLNTFGADFNDLGDRIEHAGNGALNAAKIRRAQHTMVYFSCSSPLHATWRRFAINASMTSMTGKPSSSPIW